LRRLPQTIAKVIVCLSVSSYRSALLQHRVAAGIEHDSVLRTLDCRTVVDIGANRGQFALAARRAFPGARILSFEPLSAPAARFRSVFAGDALTSLKQVAIGPQRRQATMHISGRDDSSSLLPIGERQAAMFPGTAEVGTATIDVGPLDSFIAAADMVSPALLKLDVQGFELQALQGCESLLDRFDYVYVECSFIELYAGQAVAHEVVAWLEARGFRLSGTHNMTRDASGREVQADFLFTANRA
jgi:FkbM family methyltransferase